MPSKPFANARTRRIPILTVVCVVVTLLLLCRTPARTAGGSYKQVNLLSNDGVPGTRNNAELINPWGVAFFNGSPFWINDQVTNLSQLIEGNGAPFPALPAVGVPGRPTGIVANATSGFKLPGGKPAFFIFDTLDGGILGWNSGSSAVLMVNNSTTARYTGLATATIGTRPSFTPQTPPAGLTCSIAASNRSKPPAALSIPRCRPG
jgi:hypothetical protein